MGLLANFSDLEPVKSKEKKSIGGRKIFIQEKRRCNDETQEI